MVKEGSKGGGNVDIPPRGFGQLCVCVCVRVGYFREVKLTQRVGMEVLMPLSPLKL